MVAQAPLLPVPAAGGEAVGKPAAVPGRDEPRERLAPVRGDDVRVEEDHRRRIVEVRGGEEDGLVLLAGVVHPEIVPSAMAGCAVPLGARELRETRAERIATGELGEVRIGELVLGGHPVARRLRVEVLEPAVRVGDLHAVMVLDDIPRRRRRIGPGRGRRRRGSGGGLCGRRRRWRRGGRRWGGRGGAAVGQNEGDEQE